MTDAREFTAKVDEEGRFPEHTRRAIGVVLRGYAGKVVKVTIKLQTLRRSAKQNSYYWSVVVPHWKLIFREGGTFMTDDEVHEYLVREVAKLQKPLIGPKGLPVKRFSEVEEQALTLIEEMMLGFTEGTDLRTRAEALLEHAAEMTPPVMTSVSTGELSTKEFSEFVESCRAEALIEHKHDIPPPDPDYKERKDNG